MTIPGETFEVSARAYCDLIDRHRERSCGELLHAALPMLADLLAQGHRLPDVGGDSDDLAESVGHDGWQCMYSSLGGLLGPLNSYRDSGNPYSFEDVEVLTGSLADDLADVWRDLREGLDALDRGAPREAAIWQWRWGVQAHWGQHAVDALHVLQYLHSACALSGVAEDATSIHNGLALR